MSDPIEDLDPDLAALFEADRAVDLAPSGAAARLWERLDESLPPDGGGGGEDPGDDDPGGEDPGPTPDTGAAGAGSAGAGAASPLLTHALALLVGVGAGFGAHAVWVDEPSPDAVPAPAAEVTAPAPAPADPTEPATGPDPPEPVPLEAADPDVVEEGLAPPTTPPPSAHPERRRPSASTLADERVDLEIARTALGRRAPGDAMDALRAHERRFPRSRLAEEREVLWLRSLAASGRSAEAQRRASAFLRRYPQSLFAEAVSDLATP